MQTFRVSELIAANERMKRAWTEFLRLPSLSMGIYRLQAGQSEDPQQPHTEDEVYYVVSGKAGFRAGTEEQAVVPGTLIFVERGVKHRFYDIVEDLTVLVFFAPAEGSLATGKAANVSFAG